MKKRVTRLFETLLFALVATLCIDKVAAQAPTKQWDNTFGTSSSSEEQNTVVAQLTDGSYIAVCESYGGINGDKTVANFDASNTTSDIWVIKLGANGNKIWDKAYGTTEVNRFEGVIATPDGGFVLLSTGGTSINNTRTAPSKGGADFWVIKCDANGNKLWDKVYGGALNEVINKGILTSDGGFLLTGTSRSGISGDKSEAAIGIPDTWIIKIDANGVKEWDKTMGSAVSTSPDNAFEAIEAPDGFIILTTVSGAASGTVTGASIGNNDIWVTKINKSTGSLIWQNRIGTSFFDEVFKPAITNDGSVLIPIFNDAFGVSGTKTVNSNSWDYWVVKLNSAGVKVWDKVYGSSGEEVIRGGIVKNGDGFVLFGTSSGPISGDKTEANIGQTDLWFIKIDENGNKIWDKTFGSSAAEGIGFDPAAAITAADGSLVFVIKSSALPINIDNDHDRTYKSEGSGDLWIIKTIESADLAVSVSPTTATGNKGEYLTYTVTVTNNGPHSAPNVTVKVPIPNDRTLLTAQPSAGSYSTSTKVWTIGSLANGVSATMSIILKVD